MKRIGNNKNKKSNNNLSMLDMFYLSKININKTNEFYAKEQIKNIQK